jgi:hypothetical protein
MTFKAITLKKDENIERVAKLSYCVCTYLGKLPK